MTLPNSYVQTARIREYFEAMLNANPPDRFTQRFLETLGFNGKNDRSFIGLLRELQFIDGDGKPLPRYFEFLDRSKWQLVVAEAVRETYSDLFAVNKNAYEMTVEDVKNKLRTLYAGQKTDVVIRLIAKTFQDLVEVGDFSLHKSATLSASSDENAQVNDANKSETQTQSSQQPNIPFASDKQRIGIKSLEYHINIVLPESRDQTVYDAIFRSLREHLG